MKDSKSKIQPKEKNFDSKFTGQKTPKLDHANKEILLYSCTLIQQGEDQKIHYIKIFDNFLLISKVNTIACFFLYKTVIGSLF